MEKVTIARWNYHFQKEIKKSINQKMNHLKEALICKILRIHLDHMCTAVKMMKKDFMIESKNNV